VKKIVASIEIRIVVGGVDIEFEKAILHRGHFLYQTASLFHFGNGGIDWGASLKMKNY
jgi:hypothetical protein